MCLNSQWDHLIVYVAGGGYLIDNKAAAKTNANVYSLIKTDKTKHLNVYAYLQCIFSAPPNGQSVEDIDDLLPWSVNM